jgi:hypothetical protein
MQPQEMQALLRKRPFEPFRVYLADGDVLVIRHPRLNLVTQETFIVGVANPNNPDPTIAERFIYVGWSYIAKVEPLTAAASA